MLHGPRLGRIGLRIEGGARLLIDQNGADAAPARMAVAASVDVLLPAHLSRLDW